MSLHSREREALEEQLEAYVGKQIGPPDVAADNVNEAMIRQWCDAIGDRNPSDPNPDAAVQTHHGGIVAPPTMLQAWILHGIEMADQSTPPVDEQQRLHALLDEAGYLGVVATDCEQSYTRYLKPGDAVSGKTVIESISEQKATALGTGYFINTRTTFEDQNGAEVGWMTFRVLKYVPAQQPHAASGDGDPATSATSATSAPTRVHPPKSFDNAWWWDVVDKGEVPIQKCNGCGTLHHPPRPMCSQCRGTDMGWIAACGKGTIYSYTVLHHPQFPGYDFPVVAALVDLAEGTRLVSEVVDALPEDVYIGMAVEMSIEQVDDELKMPVFRPVGLGS